jgi:hypothetical protein
MNNTRRTKTFIGARMLGAASAAGYAGFISHSLHLYFALAVLALAAATSRMKVKLPGINGNMSVNLPFLLTAIVNLSAAEAVAITCASTVVQCWPRTTLASLMFHAQWFSGTGWSSNPTGLVLAAVTLFLGQTAPVAMIVALSEGKAAGSIWWNLAHLSFPYYVISAGMGSMVQTVSAHMGWGLALAVFPVMYGIHRSYCLYFGAMAETPRTQVLVRAAGAGA